jgi:hypothetical protein
MNNSSAALGVWSQEGSGVWGPPGLHRKLHATNQAIEWNHVSKKKNSSDYPFFQKVELWNIREYRNMLSCPNLIKWPTAAKLVKYISYLLKICKESYINLTL